VKGPLASMIRELAGVEPSAAAVARHYRGLVGSMLVEHGDEADFAAPGVRAIASSIVMRSREDRVRLAREALAVARELRR